MDPLIGKILFFLGYVLPCFLIRGPHIKVRKATPVRSDRKTTLDTAMFVSSAVGSLVFPCLYVFTPLFDFADYHAPLWVGPVGVLMLVGGNWIFWKSHRDLGRNWSPTLEVSEGHTLITGGIYRRIRHPMYTALFVMLTGVAMILPNYLGGLAGLLIFSLTYILRVANEERMMIEEFGEEYRTYMQRTGRLLPKIRKPRSPGDGD